MRSKELFKRFVGRVGLTFLLVLLASGCASTRGILNNKNGPAINSITTSSKGFSIDCVPTSVTVTANITDSSGVTHAVFWYRVSSDQPFTSIDMDSQGDLYTVSVKGSTLQGNGYGTLEFYITAQDEADNSSKSPIDKSIQFLPCVSN